MLFSPGQLYKSAITCSRKYVRCFESNVSCLTMTQRAVRGKVTATEGYTLRHSYYDSVADRQMSPVQSISHCLQQVKVRRLKTQNT